jgi:hypothetical protein
MDRMKEEGFSGGGYHAGTSMEIIDRSVCARRWLVYPCPNHDRE